MRQPTTGCAREADQRDISSGERNSGLRRVYGGEKGEKIGGISPERKHDVPGAETRASGLGSRSERFEWPGAFEEFP